jgi:hypothetical protein
MNMKETDRLDGIDPNWFCSRALVRTYVPALIYINTRHLRHVAPSQKILYCDYNLVTAVPPKLLLRLIESTLVLAAQIGYAGIFAKPKSTSCATSPWRGAFVGRNFAHDQQLI